MSLIQKNRNLGQIRARIHISSLFIRPISSSLMAFLDARNSFRNNTLYYLEAQFEWFYFDD